MQYLDGGGAYKSLVSPGGGGAGPGGGYYYLCYPLAEAGELIFDSETGDVVMYCTIEPILT